MHDRGSGTEGIFQTPLGNKSRNLMKTVACATVIFDRTNGTTVILNFNDFVTDL